MRRINIGYVKLKVAQKELESNGFILAENQGQFKAFAECVAVGLPMTEKEKEIHEYRVKNLNEAQILVKVGDMVRVPSQHIKAFENGEIFVFCHSKDIMEWDEE